MYISPMLHHFCIPPPHQIPVLSGLRTSSSISFAVRTAGSILLPSSHIAIREIDKPLLAALSSDKASGAPFHPTAFFPVNTVTQTQIGDDCTSGRFTHHHACQSITGHLRGSDGFQQHELRAPLHALLCVRAFSAIIHRVRLFRTRASCRSLNNPARQSHIWRSILTGHHP